MNIKVMTFNIAHAYDFTRKMIDTRRYAEFILSEAPDICGLNEVRGAGPAAGYTDQLGELAKETGYRGYFGEALRIGGANPYGNALISRIPIRSAKTVPVPDAVDRTEKAYYETRCVILSELEAEGRVINVLVTHMGLAREERKNAVAVITDLLGGLGGPVILMGDFNMTKDDPLTDVLRGYLRDADGMSAVPGRPTFPSDCPRAKIDHIMYRGLECLAADMVGGVLSDHLALTAEFRF